jgi:hypothetical protein
MKKPLVLPTHYLRSGDRFRITRKGPIYDVLISASKSDDFVVVTAKKASRKLPEVMLFRRSESVILIKADNADKLTARIVNEMFPLIRPTVSRFKSPLESN